MTRRGKCRCGTILRFRKTSQGYKTRCPGCSAVVRLRSDEPGAARPKKSPVLTGPPPLPPVPPSPPPLPAEQTDFATEGLPQDPLYEVIISEPERPASWLTWMLFVLLALAVAGGVGAVAMWWR